MRLTRKLKSVLIMAGLGAAAAMGSGAASAQVSTTGNGPYYATPSWDQTLPSTTRYIILTNFNSEAVLDRETGLVWSRAPYLNDVLGQGNAVFECSRALIGGKGGWRLPTIQELNSLVSKPAVTSSTNIPEAEINELMDPYHGTGSAGPYISAWSSTIRTTSTNDFGSGIGTVYAPGAGKQVWYTFSADSSIGRASVFCVRSPSAGSR